MGYSIPSMMIQLYCTSHYIVGIWDQEEVISILARVEHQSSVVPDREKDCEYSSSHYRELSNPSKQCEYSFFTATYE
jgi:hypothetical protein